MKKLLVILGVGLAMAPGCAKKKSSSTTATSPTTVSPDGGGSTTTTISTPLTTTAASNISTVGDNMVPASLATTIGSSLALLDGGGPCANTNGFFDCQPIMVKLYLAIAKMIVGQVQTAVSGAGTKLSQMTLPASGSVVPGDSSTSGITKVDYNATSATDYSLLFHSSSAPFLELVVKDGTYTINMDATKSPNYDATGPGALTAVINYTDDANFTVDTKLLSFTCDPNDVSAPGGIDINISLASGAWQGKAMMMLPRFGNGLTCNTAPSSSTRLFIYSDFVGDATNTTLSLYMLPDSVTSASDFSTYPGSAFCANFPLCQSGYGFGDTKPVASYKNPACVEPTGDPTWGAACTSSDTKISTPTFSDPSLWTLPSALESATVTVPSTL